MSFTDQHDGFYKIYTFIEFAFNAILSLVRGLEPMTANLRVGLAHMVISIMRRVEGDPQAFLKIRAASVA